MGGFTVYDDAPILANRLANGNVHVEMPVRVLGTAKFKAETRTLPDEVFTTGIELPPDKIVGVRSYEDSGGLEFIPAIGPLGYSGRVTTNVHKKIGQAAPIALHFRIRRHTEQRSAGKRSISTC